MAAPATRPSYARGFARSAGQSAYPSLWQGLTGAWVPGLGNTGAKLRDNSGHKFHGDLVSAVWAPTPYGWGIDCAATGYVNVPTSKPGTNDQVTLVLFLKHDSTTNNYGLWGFGAAAYELACVHSFTNTRWNIRSAGYPTGTQADSAMVMIAADTWGQCAWRISGSNVKGYVNGEERVSVTETGFDTLPSSGLVIGARWPASLVAGMVFVSFYMYERALAPQEIRLLYQDPLAPFVRTRLIGMPVAGAPPAAATRQIIGGGMIGV